jgi:hypothetical protein
MQPALTRVIALSLALLAAGCSSGSGSGGLSEWFKPAPPAPLSPELEAQEDQKCQTDGYQINTPAYTYCRGELARQRQAVEVYSGGIPAPRSTR